MSHHTKYNDINIHGQGVDVKVSGGHVKVGPQVIVDGDIEKIHDSRKLICCHCTKSVNMRLIY